MMLTPKEVSILLQLVSVRKREMEEMVNKTPNLESYLRKDYNEIVDLKFALEYELDNPSKL